MSNTYTYLEGVMYFPFIFDKKDKFDRYSVALGIDGDQVRAAKKIGINVKKDPEKYDGMTYVHLKSNYKPDLFNAAGEEYDGPTMLSNGSKAVVKLTQRPYNNKFGQGMTTFMNAVKITDPIKYEPEGGGSNKSFDEKGSDPFVDGDEIPF